MTQSPLPTRSQSAGGLAFHADNGSHIDTVGTVFLGLALLITLLAYLRAQGRNRRLMEKLMQAHGSAP